MLNLTEDDVYTAPFVLEGGAIHVDGEGTLYTTEECLLHPNRNPNLTKEQIEEYLKDYLAIEKIIWLPHGLHQCDETNGHIDNLLHVVRPGEVALTWTDDVSDDLYRFCREAMDVLTTEQDAKGRSVRVYKLPAPGPLYRTKEESSGIDFTDGMARGEGERLAGSYANFLISNQAVIFPMLDEKYDLEAQQVLQEAFPDYEIIGVPTREIVLGGGNIHCITQQVPKVI